MIDFGYDKRDKKAFISGDISIISEVREHFSYPNKGAEFARRIGRFIPERSYIITPTFRFNVGLVQVISKYIEETYDLRGSISEELKPLVYPELPQVVPTPLGLPLRDYQRDIVKICLRAGRGTVVLATAGGKTLTFASLLETLYQNTQKKQTWKALIIVPDLGLVTQTYTDFINYKVSFSFCKWTGSNEVDISCNVVIANLGILQSKNTDIDWIRFVDVLIQDETHKLRSSNKVNKLIKQIQTPHKFGFTGTLPEENCDLWNIYGIIGPVIYERKSYELREEKYVAPVEVSILNLFYKSKPVVDRTKSDEPTKKYRAELDFIVSSVYREQVILKFSGSLQKNTLILVDYIKHGENLVSLIANNCASKSVHFIQGEVEVDERERVKKLMETQDNVICIAISKIFSTGISINNIHNIIFAGGGKAKIKTLQSIGRGLRLHASKQKLLIIDIADQLEYGQDHALKRRDMYISEKIPYKEYNLHEK